MSRLLSLALVCVLALGAVCSVSAGAGADTPETTRLWEIVRQGDIGSLKGWLQATPDLINLRAADGRGALWWAYEFGRMDMVQELLVAGAKADDVDIHGNTPSSLLNKGTAPPGQAQAAHDEDEDQEEEEEEEEDEL